MVIKIQCGLGNQMFQYAFAKALQRKKGLRHITLNIRDFRRNGGHNGFELKRVFEIKDTCIDAPDLRRIFCRQIRERLPHADEKDLYRSPGCVVERRPAFFEDYAKGNVRCRFYDGYWQSEEYFADEAEYIRSLFTFPQLDEPENLAVLPLIENTQSVALHVRRGDYLGISRFLCLGETDYYSQAIHKMEELVKQPRYFVFSDDFCWCRENLKLPSDTVFVDWNRGEKSFRDMQLMSLCRHNIIANSSFSWWGAWLNAHTDKIVIAPDRVYTRNSGYHDEHYMPKAWIKIPVEESVVG